MIKNDYGHLNAPYYLEKYQNGASVYVIPRQSEITSVSVLISKGSYQEETDQKLPFGTAYYLSEVLFDDSFVRELAKRNILLEKEVTFSYTAYTLTGVGENLLSPLSEILKRLSSLDYTEKEVESFRKKDQKRVEEEEKNPSLLSERLCAKGLYLTSPIQKGIRPLKGEGELIHASALKRFQSTYYTSDRISIFVSGKGNPKTIIEEIRKMTFPAFRSKKEEEKENKEDYEKVAESLIEVEGKGISLLTYGIKFPARKIIYEAYGEAMFYFYEMIADLLFRKNPIFLSQVADLQSELLSVSLKEAGEDAYLLLSFRSENAKEITNYLSNYLNKVSKKISSSFYERVQEEYYAKQLAILSSPYLLVREYDRSTSNHIIYPSLICHTKRLSYSSFRKFIDQIKTFPRTAVVLKK